MIPTSALLTKRKECIERLLFQKRIATGQKEAVEITKAEQLLADLPLIHPGPDCGHITRIAKLDQRPISTTVEKLAHLGVTCLLRPLRKGAHIVDKKNIGAVCIHRALLASKLRMTPS